MLFPVVDPALEAEDQQKKFTLPPLQMPHRVEPYPTYERRLPGHASPPPPIATLSRSPSVVSSRSEVATPPIRRSPPPPSSSYDYYYDHRRPSYPAESYSHQPQQYHIPPLPHHLRESHNPYHSHTPSPLSLPPTHPSPYPLPSGLPPSHPSIPIVYTEDASTKLSDRVRRRCFNCCTTDTSTWRRSNLHPGKVLCNKCGLFERTHNRNRPEQFPHKRGVGPATSQQQPAIPPSIMQGPGMRRESTSGSPPLGVGGLPPISYATHRGGPSPPPFSSNNHHHHSYNNGAGHTTLPHIGSWHPDPPPATSSSSSSKPPSPSAPAKSPPREQQSSPREERDD